MNLKIKKYFSILFATSVVLYLIVEYPYDIELIFILSCILSINVLINSIRFRIRRSKLIELGEEERFHNGIIVSIIFVGVIILIAMGAPRLEELGVLPERGERFHSNFVPIVLMPQLIQFIIGISFRELGEYFYITDKGILKSMNIEESFIWKDFQSYAVISSQKLLRFQKKNSKHLFVSYHEEYFNKHREEILSVLDKNLKRE